MILYDQVYNKTNKRIIILCSEFLLKKLCTYEMICADGTFCIAPKHFKQVFIIQGIDSVSQEGQFSYYSTLTDSKLSVLFSFSFMLGSTKW
jgi:hypothetical protein